MLGYCGQQISVILYVYCIFGRTFWDTQSQPCCLTGQKRNARLPMQGSNTSHVWFISMLTTKLSVKCYACCKYIWQDLFKTMVLRYIFCSICLPLSVFFLNSLLLSATLQFRQRRRVSTLPALRGRCWYHIHHQRGHRWHPRRQEPGQGKEEPLCPPCTGHQPAH